MSPLRYRDDDSQTSGLLFLAAGAVLGLAAGLVVADRFGGFSTLTSKVRDRIGRLREGDEDDLEDEERDEEADEDEALEERVLEAFRNDPILAERAIDIGGIGEATIELAGWVISEDEADHAVVIARGVPGVDTVLNRIAVGDVEERIRDHSRRHEEGDDALTEARWEGRTIGTGRRRQGTSDEPDRHATPRVELEERWTKAEHELQHAADDTAGIAERRTTSKKAAKGDRAGGSPVAPTGVPKGDHVVDPTADA